MKKVLYIFLAFLIAGVSFDGYSAKIPPIRLRPRPRIAPYQPRPWPKIPREVQPKQIQPKQIRTKVRPKQTRTKVRSKQTRTKARPKQTRTKQTRLELIQPELTRPELILSEQSQQKRHFNNRMNQFLENFESRNSQLLRDATIPLKKYQQTYPLVPGLAAKQADFVTRLFNQYFQEGRTYSDLMNELGFKSPLETKEDVVTFLLFHGLLEDWLTNGHLTGNLSKDFLLSTTYLFGYFPKDMVWSIARTYAELVNKIMHDVERKNETPYALRHNNIEALDHFSQQSEGNHYGYQNTTQDDSWSRQSKREESKSSFEKFRDVVDFVREIVEKLSDGGGEISVSGDSSDNEDETETESSNNTATNDTTRIELQP